MQAEMPTFFYLLQDVPRDLDNKIVHPHVIENSENWNQPSCPTIGEWLDKLQ